jgi:hypothetical protein
MIPGYCCRAYPREVSEENTPAVAGVTEIVIPEVTIGPVVPKAKLSKSTMMPPARDDGDVMGVAFAA